MINSRDDGRLSPSRLRGSLVDCLTCNGAQRSLWEGLLRFIRCHPVQKLRRIGTRRRTGTPLWNSLRQPSAKPPPLSRNPCAPLKLPWEVEPARCWGTGEIILDQVPNLVGDPAQESWIMCLAALSFQSSEWVLNTPPPPLSGFLYVSGLYWKWVSFVARVSEHLVQ